MPLPLAAVIEQLSSLPSIGPKSGLRLAVHLLSRPPQEVQELAKSIANLHQKMRFCEQCGGFSEQTLCRICANPKRDQQTVCIVEQAVDVLMMERGNHFQGRYQVLHGRLSPVDGIHASDLWLKSLDQQIEQGSIQEIILATSATVDGEATAHWLARRYQSKPLQVSRIARGVPEGGELEYLDEHTLSRALQQRIRWES
ncbi:MAG: recombination mediator RecR [Mariprofundaceae bacterium]|nr:recombination mediator RecR [Mariprofundaceae bacterium]